MIYSVYGTIDDNVDDSIDSVHIKTVETYSESDAISQALYNDVEVSSRYNHFWAESRGIDKKTSSWSMMRIKTTKVEMYTPQSHVLLEAFDVNGFTDRCRVKFSCTLEKCQDVGPIDVRRAMIELDTISYIMKLNEQWRLNTFHFDPFLTKNEMEVLQKLKVSGTTLYETPFSVDKCASAKIVLGKKVEYVDSLTCDGLRKYGYLKLIRKDAGESISRLRGEEK